MAGARIQTRPRSFTFLGGLLILHFIPAAEGVNFPVASFSLGSLILFMCASSRCLTISRLRLWIEARCKCRQELELQLKLSCIHPCYGPPHFLEAHTPIVCKMRALRHGEGTHNFELAKFTDWQSRQAHWDQPMQPLHFTAEETGPQG